MYILSYHAWTEVPKLKIVLSIPYRSRWPKKGTRGVWSFYSFMQIRQYFHQKLLLQVKFPYDLFRPMVNQSVGFDMQGLFCLTSRSIHVSNDLICQVLESSPAKLKIECDKFPALYIENLPQNNGRTDRRMHKT